MASIVKQLQLDATDDSKSVASLLLKAKIIATKLNLDDFLTWINHELNGYSGDAQIPKYRTVTGQIHGWNPYHGWQPAIFTNSTEPQSRKVTQSISDLESIDKSNTDGSTLHMPLPDSAQAELAKAFSSETKYSFLISASAVPAILGSVRSALLDWSMEIEKQGINEDVLESEQKTEMTSPAFQQINNIKNFVGNLGNAEKGSHVEVKDNVINATEVSEDIKNLIKSLKAHKGQLPEEDTVMSQIAVLEDVSKTEEGLQEAKKPLLSIKNIFEQAAGNLVAQGALPIITRILGSLNL